MKTYVAIGCSGDKDYAFLLPFTCLFWRDVIGFEPMVFLVTPPSKTMIRALSPLDLSVHVVLGDIEGLSKATLAQNIRQHAACLLPDDTDSWLMMADADLWPLKKAFYQRHVDYKGKAVLYYANGDHFQGKRIVLSQFDAGQGFQSIPTCHVTMRLNEWRQTYHLSSINVLAETKKTLGAMEPWLSRCPDQNLARWCCDQWYLTERLCRQPWFPDTPPPDTIVPPEGRILESEHVMMIQRYGHPPVDRLDRSYGFWPRYDPKRWTDAHVFKEPWTDEHWKSELEIIDALMPQHSAWARAYREEYISESH